MVLSTNNIEIDTVSEYDKLVDNLRFYYYDKGNPEKSQYCIQAFQEYKNTASSFEYETTYSVSNVGSMDSDTTSKEIIEISNIKYNINSYYNNRFTSTYKSIGIDPKDTPWPMKCHDNHHTGRSPYNSGHVNGATLWTFRCGWVEGGPAIDSDGTIYFGDYSGPFYALNPDGSVKWVFDDFERFSSITSTPAIGPDDTIYIGSWDDSMYALYPNATLKWKFKAFSTVAGSPAIADDGTVYFGTMDWPTDQGCRIYAVNADGSEKWHYETGDVIISNPAIGDDGTVYIGSMDSYFYAMNSDGSLKWRFKTEDCIKGPPSIGDDGTVYIGSYDGYLYALYPEDGSLKWKCNVGYGSETNPSIGSDGTIYVGGRELYAVNPDGTLKWSFDLGSEDYIFQSSPAISADGIIYVGTHIGGTSGGDIIAVNSDGTLRWRQRICTEWVDSSPCIGPDGTVYIGTSDNDDEDFFGQLFAFGEGEVNYPPNTPIITGISNGKTGETYTYMVSGTDPEGDDIEFYVDWGDGTNSGWQGSYTSGTEISLDHSWDNDGIYTVKAKSKDEHGMESDWTTLEVTMPKNKIINPFERFLENHPYMFTLIRQLLGL